MSHAFIREADDQWLQDIPPTLSALKNLLTRENNGVGVYEKSQYSGKNGKTVHVMSNGLSYTLDENSRWQIADSGA